MSTKKTTRNLLEETKSWVACHVTTTGLFYTVRMLPSGEEGFCFKRKTRQRTWKITIKFKRKMPVSRKREKLSTTFNRKQQHMVCTENVVRKTFQERIRKYYVSEFQLVPGKRFWHHACAGIAWGEGRIFTYTFYRIQMSNLSYK